MSEKVHGRVFYRFKRWLTLLAGVTLLGVILPTPAIAQADARGELFTLINQLRLREGLAPLGSSTLLNAAAQRHADDLVAIGLVTHTGSDGSSYQQRIREARYNAWDNGLVVDEVLWTGLGSAADAVTWFYSNPEWAILSDARYREAGVGYADDNGVRYFVVTLGARAGVLPVFINDGAETTESPAVALRLTNENAEPLGDGMQIGRAIEVRVSNSPNFDGVEWQPWEELLPWLLAGEEPGEYAVYVEFRDGANRTAVAEDIIQVVNVGESPAPPTPFIDLPVGTPATQPDISLTPVSPETEGGEPVTPPVEGGVPTQTAPVVDEEVGDPIIYATWTPLPTDVPAASEPGSRDWPLLLAFVLQGAAVLLGIAAFLRRRS